MLHKIALNLIRIYKRKTGSKLPLNGIMFRALMNPYDLLAVLGKMNKPKLPQRRYHRNGIITHLIKTVKTPHC